MVSVEKVKGGSWTYFGLSTDEKPTDCPNGSLFVEMDVARLYLFDAEGASWKEWYTDASGS